jgi:hypothetical protein
LDLNSLVAMLTHLYGISQQQQLVPSQLEHLQAQTGLANAQATAMPDKNHVDSMYPYLSPAAQKLEERKHYPEIGQQEDEVARQQEASKWAEMLQRFQHEQLSPVDRAGFEGHWGAPAMDYLAGLYTPPAPPPRLGQRIHDTNIPQTIQHAADYIPNQVGQFATDVAGPNSWFDTLVQKITDWHRNRVPGPTPEQWMQGQR